MNDDVKPRDRSINYVELKVADIARAKEFYAGAFGWTFTDYGPDYCEFSDGEMKGGFDATETPAPSGGPLVQHALPAMLDKYHDGVIGLEKIVEKMCHNPSKLFDIEKRGYIREGYFADLTAVDLNGTWTVNKENIAYKCGWSPFEGHQFKSRVTHTWVNGHLAYNMGNYSEERRGMRLTFDR